MVPVGQQSEIGTSGKRILPIRVSLHDRHDRIASNNSRHTMEKDAQLGRAERRSKQEPPCSNRRRQNK